MHGAVECNVTCRHCYDISTSSTISQTCKRMQQMAGISSRQKYPAADVVCIRCIQVNVFTRFIPEMFFIPYRKIKLNLFNSLKQIRHRSWFSQQNCIDHKNSGSNQLTEFETSHCKKIYQIESIDRYKKRLVSPGKHNIRTFGFDSDDIRMQNFIICDGFGLECRTQAIDRIKGNHDIC